MKTTENINLGFWKKLKNKKETFFCLAPMADVTDYAFREIITKYGKPDVFWTEFVSADGLCSAGKKKLLINLKFSKKQHPIVAQIFGSKPENIKKASAICAKLGFDGIDLNMGCPDKTIEKQHSGSAMIKDPKLAVEIIKAAKSGAPKLPISVKTRIGYNKDETDTWIKEILSQNISALTVHLRTRKEMSNVPAHWDLMKKIVSMRNEMKKETLIIGNGDISSTEDGKQKAKESGCDGVMIGRGIFGNPWLFGKKKKSSMSLKNKLDVLVEHVKLFEKTLGKHKKFHILRRHFKSYVNGFDNAKELRIKLMETENSKQVEKLIRSFDSAESRRTS